MSAIVPITAADRAWARAVTDVLHAGADRLRSLGLDGSARLENGVAVLSADGDPPSGHAAVALEEPLPEMPATPEGIVGCGFSLGVETSRGRKLLRPQAWVTFGDRRKIALDPEPKPLAACLARAAAVCRAGLASMPEFPGDEAFLTDPYEVVYRPHGGRDLASYALEVRARSIAEAARIGMRRLAVRTFVVRGDDARVELLEVRKAKWSNRKLIELATRADDAEARLIRAVIP